MHDRAIPTLTLHIYYASHSVGLAVASGKVTPSEWKSVVKHTKEVAFDASGQKYLAGVQPEKLVINMRQERK